MIKYPCDVCGGDAFPTTLLSCSMETQMDAQCVERSKVSAIIQYKDLKIEGKAISHICSGCLCRLIKSAKAF